MLSFFNLKEKEGKEEYDFYRNIYISQYMPCIFSTYYGNNISIYLIFNTNYVCIYDHSHAKRINWFSYD